MNKYVHNTLVNFGKKTSVGSSMLGTCFIFSGTYADNLLPHSSLRRGLSIPIILITVLCIT